MQTETTILSAAGGLIQACEECHEECRDELLASGDGGYMLWPVVHTATVAMAAALKEPELAGAILTGYHNAFPNPEEGASEAFDVMVDDFLSWLRQAQL